MELTSGEWVVFVFVAIVVLAVVFRGLCGRLMVLPNALALMSITCGFCFLCFLGSVELGGMV